MSRFADILAAAEAGAGGSEALAARLPRPAGPAELAAVPDDRYLSLMSLRVFRAGIKHSVVDARWPAFEEVFAGFAPGAVRAMSDEDLEALMNDARLIRHWGKIRATRDNAASMCLLAEEKGGFGRYLADWPADDTVGLWRDIASRFSQMGGNSAPVFLRMAGKDTFILTPDVVRALNRFAGIDGTPRNRRDHARVQEIFNAWSAETGRPLSALSLILAAAAGERRL